MNEQQRDEVARILEMVAAEGLPHPRNLDAALDAIADTLAFPDEVLAPAFDHSYREANLTKKAVVWNRKYQTYSEYAGVEYLNGDETTVDRWVVE